MNDNIFAKRLRGEREKLGLKQKEMAIKLNIPPTTYNGYETGNRMPALDVARDIADALNVTTDFLLGRTDERTFTLRDEKSIQNDLKKIMEEFKTGKAGPAFYDGVEFESDELELIENAMETALKIAKLKNKEKYTPNKYKYKNSNKG